jgi:membrane protease YdiL (CAAX protease family)
VNAETKEFLKSLQAPVAAKSFQYLVFYFIFAATVHLLDYGFPHFFPSWFREFGFQIFLFGSLIFLWRAGWRPQWQCRWRSLIGFGIFLGAYFAFLVALEFVARGMGFEAWARHRSEPLHRVVLLIFLAPLLEELFFRDYLLRAFYWQMNRFRRALFFSSGFFMLAHLSLYPGAFFLGLVNGILFSFFRSAWPAVAFHAVSNLSLFFLPRYFPALTEAMKQIELLPLFHP